MLLWLRICQVTEFTSVDTVPSIEPVSSSKVVSLG